MLVELLMPGIYELAHKSSNDSFRNKYAVGKLKISLEIKTKNLLPNIELMKVRQSVHNLTTISIRFV